jgi:tetratricopeptide (TPR) repeat protein
LPSLERLCRERESPGALQACLQNQGEAYLAEGEPNRALSCFQEQERICDRIGDLPGLGAAIGCQGLALQRLGRASEALALRKREEAIARQLEDPDMLQVSLTYQAELLGEAGDFSGAFAMYSAADEIARRIHAWDGLRVSLGKSGAMHERLGQNAEALAAYREQQQLARDLENRYAEDRALRNQTRVLLATDDLEGALFVFHQLETLATDPVGGAREAVNQAAILDDLDRYAEAVDAARRALDLLGAAEAGDDVTAISDLAHEILDRKPEEI